MPVAAEILAKPLNWRDPAVAPVLERLQGNILKGHGRDHTSNLFLRFDTARRDEARSALRRLGGHLTSAMAQLTATDAFKQLGVSGGTGLFLMISAAGYRALGIAEQDLPGDEQFRAGMKARAPVLHDPAPFAWDAKFKEEAHALLIVADDNVTAVGNAAITIEAELARAGVTVIGRDAGHALRRTPKGLGIEHFGYVDGRSQPLMLQEEVDAERDQHGGIDQWDPAFGPGELILVKDPNGGDEDAYGSYLVYRKLEQNVRGFKEQELALAGDLKLIGLDKERAGAMVVGRFEDGTPLVTQKVDGGTPEAGNNFNYDGDLDGLKCPFQAHIRKVNPRGGTRDEFGAPIGDERSHLMARRGIPFGERSDNLDDIPTLPRRGVGLLFMAYNQDIARQFEFTQASWANNADFLRAGTGIDPVIGELAPGATGTQSWRSHYGAPASEQVASDFHAFVTMRGGEYFFAPSLGFFAAL